MGDVVTESTIRQTIFDEVKIWSEAEQKHRLLQFGSSNRSKDKQFLLLNHRTRKTTNPT